MIKVRIYAYGEIVTYATHFNTWLLVSMWPLIEGSRRKPYQLELSLN